MKVLHFNSNISRNSGVLSIIMNYYRIIDKNNIQFDFLFFCNSSVSYKDDIQELGGKTYSICNPKNILLFRKELRRFFREHENEYDIVHIHDAIFAKFMYDIIKKAGVKQVIIHSHATNFSDQKISCLRNYLLCYNIQKYGDTMFACSKAAGKFMFGKNQFYVMNNAISIKKYQFSPKIRNDYRKKLNLKNKFVVGHVGAFVKQKNHMFLLDIYSEIVKKMPNSLLLLVGDGPLFQEVKYKANVLGLKDKILFLGKRTDVNKLYQTMDVFILPSLFEGLPMVGIEAQCSGLPIVMSTEITMETAISNYAFVDLDKSEKIWAEKVIDLYNINQRESLEAVSGITEKGFNIEVEGKKLELKYHELIQ